MHERALVNAVADALHSLRFEVLEDLDALAFSRNERPVDSAEDRLHRGQVLVAIDAEQRQVERRQQLA